MNQFTVFYSDDSYSSKLIEVINQYKLQSLFNLVEINYSQIQSYRKYLQTIPTIINNKSNDIINRDQSIEFVIRLNLHLSKNNNSKNILPYYQQPSTFSNFFSNINNSTENSYSNLSFHEIDTKIPNIKTLSETKPLSVKDFSSEYDKKLKERNISAE